MRAAETSRSGEFVVVHIRENEENTRCNISGLEILDEGVEEILDEGIESFTVGDWVLVSYDSELFPGEITNTTDPKTNRSKCDALP